MGKDILFYMDARFRQSLIDSHLFFVDEAKRRLLSQFNDVASDADKASNKWIEKNKANFNPEYDDEGSFIERAFDVGQIYYESLTDMRTQTYLSVVAGMYHQWDKALRLWLVEEISRWHSGKNLKNTVWLTSQSNIDQLLGSLWGYSSEEHSKLLDACRVVVNVYKHGRGKSLDELRAKYPEYLDDPFRGFENDLDDVFYRADYLDYIHLKVTEEQLQLFSKAIVNFWNSIPQYTFDGTSLVPPKWFKSARDKDL